MLVEANARFGSYITTNMIRSQWPALHRNIVSPCQDMFHASGEYGMRKFSSFAFMISWLVMGNDSVETRRMNQMENI